LAPFRIQGFGQPDSIEAGRRLPPTFNYVWVSAADEPLFNSLMESHHYLKYEQPVGDVTFCYTSSSI